MRDKSVIKFKIPISEKIMADKHWYELNPTLFEAEKLAMSKLFPQFTLDKLDDGRLCWIGKISSSELKGEYNTLVVYDNNHPHCCEEYSSVKIYPVFPDIDEMLGTWFPASMIIKWTLKDAEGNKYMRLRTEKEAVDDINIIKTAASFLNKAIYWLRRIELRKRFIHSTQMCKIKIANGGDDMAEDIGVTVEVGRSQNHGVISNADAESFDLYFYESFGNNTINYADEATPEVGKNKFTENDTAEQKRCELRKRLIHSHPINRPAGKDVAMQKRFEMRSDPIDCMRNHDSKYIHGRQKLDLIGRKVDLNSVKTIDGKIVVD